MTECGQQGTVLVVDDNPLILNVLRSLLSAEQYEVFAFDNGADALQSLERHPVDLIICDVMMPTMGGYELQETIRARAEYCHIPFVFLTALDGSDDKQKGKESGADDYVLKPFDPKEILALVRGKIHRAKSLKKQSEEKYDIYRRKVLHTLSHEFRTPLVAINTGTELILEQQGLDNKKVRTLVEAIQRGGLRLERLVNDFMILQQIEAGLAERLFQTRAVEVPAQALGERIASHVRGLVEEAKGVLDVHSLLSGQVVKVYEPQILDSVFRLVQNSVKFSKEVPQIELEYMSLGDEVAFTVKDRGVGFDPEKMKQALVLFTQFDRDKMEQQGSGIGLTIAAHYAHIHGGRVEFESRDLGGAAVHIILPTIQVVNPE